MTEWDGLLRQFADIDKEIQVRLLGGSSLKSHRHEQELDNRVKRALEGLQKSSANKLETYNESIRSVEEQRETNRRLLQSFSDQFVDYQDKVRFPESSLVVLLTSLRAVRKARKTVRRAGGRDRSNRSSPSSSERYDRLLADLLQYTDVGVQTFFESRCFLSSS